MVITLNKPISSLAVHPKQSGILALGFINGEIRIVKLIHPCTSKEHLNNIWRKRLKDAVRGLEFSHDGKYLHSIDASNSLCVINVETAKRIRRIDKAHESEPSAIHCFRDGIMVRDQSLITGDEDGQVSGV